MELYRQGVSRASGDKDGNAGSFLPPAYPGYCHHFGVGKTLPPTVPPMLNAGSLAYTEQESPRH